MMEKQIQESEGLSCRLAERDTLIVTIIQNAMMEGKIQRDLARRSHCGGYGLWKGKQTSSLPWAGGPHLLHADSEEEHEG